MDTAGRYPSTGPNPPGASLDDKHPPLAWVLLVVNVAVMALPPIYLTFAGGNMTAALVYFIGAPVLLLASMFALPALVRSTGGAL